MSRNRNLNLIGGKGKQLYLLAHERNKTFWEIAVRIPDISFTKIAYRTT